MRPSCSRCLRPVAFCVCSGLRPVATRTRIVLLQHPREARLAICSAWLTRLALENAELHRGISFERHEAVRDLLQSRDAALLHPSGAPASSRSSTPPPVLFVIDGTWLQAEKMLAANPRIAALPKLGVSPPAPSGYEGLRREPAPHCLSTLEAVAYALADLDEGPPARFEPMRAAFRRMVQLQLECSRDGRRAPRHRKGGPPRLAVTGTGD